MKILIGVLSLTAFCTTALADSDGYYCATDRYLAYQLHEPGKRVRHVLFVVTPAKGGDLQTGKTELPEFQVHGMRCLAESVELLGWDRIVKVDVRQPNAPVAMAVERVAEPPAKSLPSGFIATNLAEWNERVVQGESDDVDLPWDTGPNDYRVVVAARMVSPCRYLLKSRLVVKSSSASAERVFPIVTRQFERDCG